MEFAQMFKRLDAYSIIVIILAWWNLSGSINTKFTNFESRFTSIENRITDIDKRLTVIETVMLLDKRLPSHVATGDE